MAGNTLVGYYWRDVILREISTEAWEYLAVCVPIVVIGAPFGSVLGSHFHRQVGSHASTGATSIPKYGKMHYLLKCSFRLRRIIHIWHVSVQGTH